MERQRGRLDSSDIREFARLMRMGEIETAYALLDGIEADWHEISEDEVTRAIQAGEAMEEFDAKDPKPVA